MVSSGGWVAVILGTVFCIGAAGGAFLAPGQSHLFCDDHLGRGFGFSDPGVTTVGHHRRRRWTDFQSACGAVTQF